MDLDYLAQQVGVPAEQFGRYSWRSRLIEFHRAQVRATFGFREFSRGDEDKLAGWLAEEICPVELSDERLREAVMVRCRAERIETPGRIDRIGDSANDVRASVLPAHAGHGGRACLRMQVS